MNQLTLALLGTDLRMNAYYEGRQYENEEIAKREWERVMEAAVPDAGASRCIDPAQRWETGRFIVFMAFGMESWEALEPYLTGEPWEPEEGFVDYLIRKRLKAAMMGSGSFTHRDLTDHEGT